MTELRHAERDMQIGMLESQTSFPRHHGKSIKDTVIAHKVN